MAADKDFQWDAPIDADTFFNDSPEDLEMSAQQVIDEVTKTEDVVEKEEDKTPEHLNPDVFFDDEDEAPGSIVTPNGEVIAPEGQENKPNGDNKTEDKDGKKSDDSVKSPGKGQALNTLNFLKEKGFLDFELEEGQELTEETASEMLEDNFDNMIEERFEELFEGLPDIVKEFNKFVSNGGDPLEYIKQVNSGFSSPGISKGMDMTSEDNQIKVMKTLLAEEGHDQDYIEMQIEFLKEKGQLEKISTSKFAKWEENVDAKKAELVEKQKEAIQKAKENKRAYKKDISATLAEGNSIGGVTYSKNDALALPDYVAERTVELDNGAVITAFQHDVYSVLQNKEASLQLAILMRNRNEDGTFNFKSIEESVTDKVTKETKEKLRNGGKRKSFADFNTNN